MHFPDRSLYRLHSQKLYKMYKIYEIYKNKYLSEVRTGSNVPIVTLGAVGRVGPGRGTGWGHVGTTSWHTVWILRREGLETWLQLGTHTVWVLRNQNLVRYKVSKLNEVI